MKFNQKVITFVLVVTLALVSIGIIGATPNGRGGALQTASISASANSAVAIILPGHSNPLTPDSAVSWNS